MARSAKHCDSLAHSLVDCRELSTLINSLLKSPPPKQHNRQDVSSGCLEASCQAQSTLIMQLVIVFAVLSAMSDISQGSVTTPMRCGWIFSIHVTTNFLLIPTVYEFCRLIFNKIIGMCAVFGPPCIVGLL